MNLWIRIWIITAATVTVLASAGVAEAEDRVALPIPPGMRFETLCGSSVPDLVDVEKYTGQYQVNATYVREHEPSTVQLNWLGLMSMYRALPDYSLGNVSGRPWCSGTLIGLNLVLTAGHCFDAQKGTNGWITPFKAGNVYLPPTELAKMLVVNVGLQIDGSTGKLRAPATFPITTVREHRKGSDKLDFAIIEVGKNDAGKLPGHIVTPAKVSALPLNRNDLLAIIQHPYLKNEGLFRDAAKKIHDGSVQKTEGTLIHYDNIDTLHASSGAGIRDKNGVVRGVHVLGGCGRSSGANKGVSMEAIAKVSGIL